MDPDPDPNLYFRVGSGSDLRVWVKCPGLVRDPAIWVGEWIVFYLEMGWGVFIFLMDLISLLSRTNSGNCMNVQAHIQHKWLIFFTHPHILRVWFEFRLLSDSLSDLTWTKMRCVCFLLWYTRFLIVFFYYVFWFSFSFSLFALASSPNPFCVLGLSIPWICV